MAYEIDYRDLDEEQRIASKIRAWRAQPVKDRVPTARNLAGYAARHDSSNPFAYDVAFSHAMRGLHIGNRGTNY